MSAAKHEMIPVRMTFRATQIVAELLPALADRLLLGYEESADFGVPAG